MHPNSKAFAAILFILAPWGAYTAEPERCSSTLTPLSTPAPPYPSPEQAAGYLPGTSYAHNFVEGAVEVGFVVIKTGAGEDVAIVNETVNPVVRNASTFSPTHFKGFLTLNVLDTVSGWRYEPVGAPCYWSTVIKYRFEADA